jgi:hypothetical protein
MNAGGAPTIAVPRVKADCITMTLSTCFTTKSAMLIE